MKDILCGRCRIILTEHNAQPSTLKQGKFYEEAERISNETGIKQHVDHIIPLQGKTVCGLHVPWNL